MATYTARSGSTNVFSVNSGGIITANGNGVDLLDVSYGGLTAAAQIAVGAYLYVRSESIQSDRCRYRWYRRDSSHDAARMRLDCWGAGVWAPLTQPSGSGSSTLSLMAAASIGRCANRYRLFGRNHGARNASSHRLQLRFVANPGIDARAAGMTGTVNVTTSCPVIVISNQAYPYGNATGVVGSRYDCAE